MSQAMPSGRAAGIGEIDGSVSDAGRPPQGRVPPTPRGDKPAEATAAAAAGPPREELSDSAFIPNRTGPAAWATTTMTYGDDRPPTTTISTRRFLAYASSVGASCRGRVSA